MKFKLFASVCVAAGLAFGLAGCGDDNAPKSGDAKTLTVGASPVPHADILNLIAPPLQKEGITLKVIEFSDEVIEQRQRDIAKAHNIRLTNHSLYLYGHCANGDCKHDD